MSAVEKFPILLSEAEEESSAVPPCFSDEGINVCHLQRKSPSPSDLKSVLIHSTQ
jgi:AP-1 complex subunit mu